MRQPNKILIIQTAFLGDLILLSSLFRLLRMRLPEAEISAVLSPLGQELFQNNAWNVEVIPFDKRGADRGPLGLWRFSRKLKARNFDWCLSLHRYARSSLLAYLSGAKQVYGYREAPFSFLFTNSVDRSAQVFEAEKNLAVLQSALQQNEMDPVQAKLSDLYPELRIQTGDIEAAREVLPGGTHSSYVVISPSSAWTTKRWPVERFAKIAKQLYEQGRNVVLVGGSSEEDQIVATELTDLLATEIRANGSRQNWLKNLMGRTSIAALRGIIAESKLVLCNDSAPMHLACAFNRPCISIFGPTTKDLGFFPLSKDAPCEVIERRLQCRPCGLHGHKNCPLDHFRCMLEIEVPLVMRTVESVLCP